MEKLKSKKDDNYIHVDFEKDAYDAFNEAKLRNIRINGRKPTNSKMLRFLCCQEEIIGRLMQTPFASAEGFYHAVAPDNNVYTILVSMASSPGILGILKDIKILLKIYFRCRLQTKLSERMEEAGSK